MSKVFVGLSGGVDSAVAARLLLDQGYEVTGVFIKIWQPEFIECTWEEDRLSAKRVAAALGIPFREIDLSDEYKTQVVEDMIRGYESGRTPNPDVLCNRHIKFGAFRIWAKAHGADKIATGHYARIVARDGQYELHRGKDVSKDQAYFLNMLTQDDLRDALFPVGHYSKKDIRAIARRVGLPNAARPDSQGLCFVGDVRIGDFLTRFIPLTSGPVLDMQGVVIGTHAGSAQYTIGQRHGFTLDVTHSDEKPHYIVRIDTKENTLTVSTDLSDAQCERILVHDAHWINEEPTKGKSYTVELRYHQKPMPACVIRTADEWELELSSLQIVSSGQSAVIYDGDRCFGGGIVS
ncbi:tRNA 2-thiouridine(34) synthase MnmA [Candidatus Kaiserbacteria bacterium]|nr:tRNA 2-thiouridine(34) synthase MnmA [Candidatus Kaiserbacteria bacterium]